MDNRAFLGFTRSDFAWASRNFRGNGYQSVDAVRDVDTRGREMFLPKVKPCRDRSRNRLSELRLAFRIFAWFGHAGSCAILLAVVTKSILIAACGLGRSICRLSPAPLRPGRDMANFFSGDMERGRLSRPPYTPYVTTDSLACYPWLRSGDPQTKTFPDNTSIGVLRRTLSRTGLAPLPPPSMEKMARVVADRTTLAVIPRISFLVLGHS